MSGLTYEKAGISDIGQLAEPKTTGMGYPLYRSLGFQDATLDYRDMKWKNGADVPIA